MVKVQVCGLQLDDGLLVFLIEAFEQHLETKTMRDERVLFSPHAPKTSLQSVIIVIFGREY